DVPPPPQKSDVPMRPLPAPHQEAVIPLSLDGRPHRFTLLAVIGGKGLAPTPGELSVSAGLPGEVPRLLGGADAPPLTDDGWEAYVAAGEARHRAADRARRLAVGAPVAAAWEARHRRIREWALRQPAPAIPRVSSGTPVLNPVDRFVGARLEQAKA